MGTASDRGSELVVGGQRVELQLTSISACTLRVSLLPIAADGSIQPAANSPELAIAPAGPPMAKIRSLTAPEILAKSLVEAQHGHISAASEGPGKGATFTVRMPRVP